MFSPARVLLVSVLLSRALQDARLSQRARCVPDRCYASFLKAVDFSGAKKSCQDSGGHLFDFSLEQAEKTLSSVLRGIGGSFWLSGNNGTVSGFCSFISAAAGGSSTLLWTRCPAELDGFLCQYAVEGACGSVRASAGTQVSYVAHAGFEVTDSETFPSGTIATAQQPGGESPDWKRVCSFGIWLKAPWTCEVLNGGCEHSCDDTTKSCACPAGQSLQPNNVTCAKDPCAECAQACAKHGDTYVCECAAGYRLAQDSKSCVDVDECKDKDQCAGAGERCVNTQGGFECDCIDDFIMEDGACTNVSICEKCEHMQCVKSNGVYECKCKKGFRVSPTDPTSCEQHCSERDCPARCVRDPEVEKEDMQKCFCPEGYIRDARNNTVMCTDIDECELKEQCHHKCENMFGGFRCLCDEGYKLHNDYMCLPADVEVEGIRSGLSYPTPASAHPVTVPSYVKTGSVMGITIFMLLCAGLLYFLGRYMSKYSGKFELSSLKGPDIDIFYLQQVSTDSYRLINK